MQQRVTKSQQVHKDYMQIIVWNNTCILIILYRFAKIDANNPNLDLVNAYMQNFVKFHLFVLTILSGN